MAYTPNWDITPPSWLNNEFLEKALKSGDEDGSIKVISSEIKGATNPGDNYSSDIFRATVQIARGAKEEEMSLIIKTLPSSMTEEMVEVFEVSNTIQQEINNFSIIHPALLDVLDKISMGRNQPFAAKHVYSQNEHSMRAIVLEDLKVQGFRLAERTMCLDLEHCLLVMRTIARFHAAALAAYQKDAKIKELSIEDLNNETRNKGSEPFFTSTMRTCANEVARWPDYKERYADKLYKVADAALKEWYRGLELEENCFNLLNHGDLWTNNMMFRYSDETGEVEDVRFVDFQLARWTSPVVDLLYFINSSATEEVIEQTDMLIEEYYRTFCEILSLLGYEHLQPSLKELNDEIKRRGHYGMMAGVIIRNIALTDRGKGAELNKMMSNEDSNVSERYKESMKKLLPLYEKWGWL